MSDDLPSSSRATRRPGWWSRLLAASTEVAGARSDIVEFLARCRRSNLLDTDEHAMLQGVLKVSETQVRDIMVPRSYMVVLERDDSPETLLDTIVDSGHSRFPVIGEGRDEVVGILLAKDLLRYFGERRPSDALPDRRAAPPGRIHTGEQAPRRAAHPVSREPQPHRHRRGRIRGAWPASPPSKT